MLFYFSGTGNSAWVAQAIATGIGEDTMLLMPTYETDYMLSHGEPLGFVFPCYAWGVPLFIENFVRNLKISNVSYVYFVMTCGDDTGYTSELFCGLIGSKGWECSLGYAIQMPESYVNLPGFDVDTEDKVISKFGKAKERLSHIITDISNRRKDYFDTLPGGFKWLKSYVVRPFFNRFLITPKPFKSNKQCNLCGRCVNVCPFSNISLSDTELRPCWGESCVMCMRCYHSCPQHAVQWGCFTKNKGQYLFSKHRKILS